MNLHLKKCRDCRKMHDFEDCPFCRERKIELHNCGDCGVKEGKLHHSGCDQEFCSKCGKQVLVWGKCKGAKSESFFYKGFSCVRCGEFFPQMKMVSDKEWDFICGKIYDKGDVLCVDCMDFIKKKRGDKNGKRT